MTIVFSASTLVLAQTERPLHRSSKNLFVSLDLVLRLEPPLLRLKEREVDTKCIFGPMIPEKDALGCNRKGRFKKLTNFNGCLLILF